MLIPTRSARTANGWCANRPTCCRWRSGIFSSDEIFRFAPMRFTAPPLAAEIHHGSDPPAHALGYTRDSITLAWEDRLRGRGRRRSDGGLEFATALPRGTVLGAGDWLMVHDRRTAVAVIEREEAVFIIEPASAAEWGRYA